MLSAVLMSSPVPPAVSCRLTYRHSDAVRGLPAGRGTTPFPRAGAVPLICGAMRRSADLRCAQGQTRPHHAFCGPPPCSGDTVGSSDVSTCAHRGIAPMLQWLTFRRSDVGRGLPAGLRQPPPSCRGQSSHPRSQCSAPQISGAHSAKPGCTAPVKGPAVLGKCSW
ncbi:hypothetical protein NDU88_005501 [Pleurodeles waltl]|uniref:Uncharacterized protein n=1 Tax=Pleurodeles waltl TaxID=8319 RepID=A0AAV7UJS4_PLEWA|nr:hypothetical protein NDU88_005501 [Pleurodeles waltl]